MATYRLIPEDDWERAMSALEDAIARLRVCGHMTLPDVPPASSSRRRSAAAHGGSRGADGVVLAREVVDRVDAGGPRHVPKQFDRTGPKIADFVAILTNGDPFKISDLIEPVRQYVVLKDTRRAAGGQVRTAVAKDSRFRRLDAGVFQTSATGNDATARPLIEEMR